jgi:hypothetical protein
MSGTPDFISNAAELAKRKLSRDVERIQKRPAWLPADHPDGEPFVGFGIPHQPDAPVVTDGVTVRHLSADEIDAASARLSDAQVEGFHAEAQVRRSNDAQRQAAALRAQVGGQS